MAECDRSKARLANYAIGGGSRRQRARLDRHLAVCPTCRVELAALVRTGDLLARLSIESAPAGTWEAVRVRLTPRTAFPRPTRRRLRPAWRLALASAMLLAIGAVLLGFFPRRPAASLPGPAMQPDVELRASLEKHLSAARFAPLADDAAIGLDLETAEEDS